MYESLTGYLAVLEGTEDRTDPGVANDGEDAYVGLEREIRSFVMRHPEYGSGGYVGILEENGIADGWQSMRDADVSELDGRAIMALLVGAIEKKNDNAEEALGALSAQECVSDWLERLRVIDEEGDSGSKAYENEVPLSTHGKIAEAIVRLYDVTRDLEKMFPGRHFTPDGHLVGSMGEVYAAERYGLKLFRAGYKAHDGETSDGRLVQIKATQRRSVGISEEPKYLIVLRIDENGGFHEEYNGPGKPVWELFRNRKRPKNGQYQVSLGRLRTLNADVTPQDRIKTVVRNEQETTS